MSGPIVQELVINTLLSLGFNIVDLGLSTTPTVEIAVTGEKAAGGIIITASHNPREWNALKLLNSDGEFISAEDGALVLSKAEKEDFTFCPVDKLGSYSFNDTYLNKHIEAILAYPLVEVENIKKKHYKIVVDVVNSTGSMFIPPLLKKLGVDDVIVLNGEVDGRFAHNPEPLPENLSGLSAAVRKHKADLGIAVDPDVDQALFCLRGWQHVR